MRIEVFIARLRSIVTFNHINCIDYCYSVVRSPECSASQLTFRTMTRAGHAGPPPPILAASIALPNTIEPCFRRTPTRVWGCAANVIDSPVLMNLSPYSRLSLSLLPDPARMLGHQNVSQLSTLLFASVLKKGTSINKSLRRVNISNTTSYLLSSSTKMWLITNLMMISCLHPTRLSPFR